MHIFFARTLYWISRIALILFLLLYAFVFIVLIIKMLTGGFVVHDVPVHMKSLEDLPVVSSDNPAYSLHSIPGAEVILKLNIKMTPANTAIILTAFTVASAFVLTILSHLTKIFKAVAQRGPFAIENIRRLRTISGCLAVIALINLLSSLFHKYILEHYFEQSDTYYLGKIDIDWVLIFLAVCVFILSAIFRQGYQLQTENESII